jgi:hypothetical protein
MRFLNGDHVRWPSRPDGAAGDVAACLEEVERGEKLYWVTAFKGAPTN